MPRQERAGRHPAKAVVRPILVVDVEPRIGYRLQFAYRFKQMCVEHFGAIRAIEAFEVRVLIGPTGLNVVNRHAVIARTIRRRPAR